MKGPLGDHLYRFQLGTDPAPSLERRSARELGLKESWFSDAIFRQPELVISPCRAAGLTDDDWYAWAREFPVEVGQIDVLLLSSQGRIGIVEAKLAGNPELRRRVLAQALDYLTHLSDALEGPLPEIPRDENGDPVADIDDIRESARQGDVLLIVVSDDIDPRVSNLSRGLLGSHLIKQWDLVLLDLALYGPAPDASDGYAIVPCIRGLVVAEPRQVVRVVVQGESPSTRVEVEHFEADEAVPARQKWDEERYFERLEAGEAPRDVRELALRLRELAREHADSASLAWGTGKRGTMILKRNGKGLIEIRGRGVLRFRPRKFAAALGDGVARSYHDALVRLFPEAMAMTYPRVPADEAARAAAELYEVVSRAVEDAQGEG